MSLIQSFLNCTKFGVVGASSNTSKFGYKVLLNYINHNKDVIAINPRASENILNIPTFPTLSDVPEDLLPEAISVIIPPRFGVALLEEAVGLGIQYIWFQPGAFDESIIEKANEIGFDNIIATGDCVLVQLS